MLGKGGQLGKEDELKNGMLEELVNSDTCPTIQFLLREFYLVF